MNRRIVVGVSGNPAGMAAAEWALDYAEARQADVEFVHVVDDKWPVLVRARSGGAFLEAEREMRDRADQAVEAHPRVNVHPTVIEGSPVDRLVDEADGAELLVIGTHTLRRFDGLVFSTRAAHVAAVARCSVAVVPVERGEPTGRGVVVGVDGSPASAAAVTFAAREADRLGQPLRAVFAWRVLAPWGTDDGGRDDPTDDDRAVLAEALAGIAEDYPDLEVEEILTDELPADSLVTAAHGARLLVVGTHGRHGLAKLWLGSVSHELLLTMPCTVAVIRPEPV